jgi:hypothetical protein
MEIRNNNRNGQKLGTVRGNIYEAQANTDTKEPNDDNLKDRQPFDLTFTTTVE